MKLDSLPLVRKISGDVDTLKPDRVDIRLHIGELAKYFHHSQPSATPYNF